MTCIQRFGSALNLNLHFHTLVPDGVFYEDADGQMLFRPLDPPTRSALEKLIRKIVPRLLLKLGAEDLPEHAGGMAALAQSLQSGSSKAVDDPPRGLCVLAEGFSLHAGVFVDELDGDALERLARYCARPPLALRRLSLAEDGQILYRVKHAAPGAPQLLRLSPMQFLGRLAALVPPPRSRLTRFHGLFAPHSKHRDHIVPAQPDSAVPSPPTEVPTAAACADPGKKQPSSMPLPSPPRGPYRLPWATLLPGCSPSTCSPAIAVAASDGLWRSLTGRRRSPRSLRILACPKRPRALGRLARLRRSSPPRDRWPKTASTRFLRTGTTKPSLPSVPEHRPHRWAPPVVYLPIAQTGKNLVVFPTLTIVYPHIASWAPLALLRGRSPATISVKSSCHAGFACASCRCMDVG